MVERKDLVDIGDADYDTRRNEFVQCQACGNEFGGTRGDYFQMPMDGVFYCPECGDDNLALVKRVFTIKIIKQ